VGDQEKNDKAREAGGIILCIQDMDVRKNGREQLNPAKNSFVGPLMGFAFVLMLCREGQSLISVSIV